MNLFGRQKLLEILNSGQYASPIIVFVNQKKTADMVAKDLSRAGVRSFFDTFELNIEIISGMLRPSIPGKTKKAERRPCNPCGMANRMYSWRQTWLDVVLMSKMSVS